MIKTLILIASLLIILFFSFWYILSRFADTGHGRLRYKVALLLKLSDLQHAIQRIPEDETSVEKRRKRALDTALRLKGKPVKLAKVENKMISGPSGDIPIRIYTPVESQILPVILFCHGGGWVSMNIDTHDIVCRKLAKTTKTIVVSVDYRLAPDFPFPAGLNDAYAALKWVSENASSFSGDSSKLVVAGDSAGGNLSASLTIKARDEKGPNIAHQVLIYPATDLSSTNRDSYRYFENGYFLSKKSVEWYIENYIKNPEDRKNIQASPLLADDLSNLPPATIINGEIDVLIDEGKLYAEKLKQAGVQVNRVVIPGMIHGFLNISFFKETNAVMQIIAEDLAKSLR